MLGRFKRAIPKVRGLRIVALFFRFLIRITRNGDRPTMASSGPGKPVDTHMQTNNPIECVINWRDDVRVYLYVLVC